jgi:metallo-beta-lactamase family protein
MTPEATITFHGAAGTVTGSKTLVDFEGYKLLVDCGLFQGLKALRELNWAPPAFDPRAVRWVILTHAHIDHSGWLPRLVKSGFRGTIFGTPATAELAALLLRDSARLQEEDAEFLNEKQLSKHRPALPLYDGDDAERAIALLRTVRYGHWQHLTSRIAFRYTNAGHLLGSGLVEVRLTPRGGHPRTVLFSGDVGRYGMPLNPDPAPPPPCDVMVLESTYGDRSHSRESLHDQVATVARRTFDSGGILLVPAFAVGRAQQLILIFRELAAAGRIPRTEIHLDSPMAIDATEIYCRYPDEHPVPLEKLGGEGCVLFGPEVRMSRTREESKRLNRLDGPAIVVSSSGMMTGGRILHHLSRLLPDPRNTVLITGFQAAGTRGRALCEGARYLRIHGRDVAVGAEVAELHGLSGHADADELLRWTGALSSPRTVFLTHGEPDAAEALAKRLGAERGWNTIVPALHQSFVL